MIFKTNVHCYGTVTGGLGRGDEVKADNWYSLYRSTAMIENSTMGDVMSGFQTSVTFLHLSF